MTDNSSPPSPRGPEGRVTIQFSLPSALQVLRDHARWVGWRWQLKPNGGWDKPLYCVNFPDFHASTQKPNTWAYLDAAERALAGGQLDGIGYVLRDDTQHVYLDLDDCRDPETGELAEWASELVEACNSYTEITPSGRGIRIIGTHGGFLHAPIHTPYKLPGGGKGEVFFRAARYVTVTGIHLPGAATAMSDISGPVLDLLAKAGRQTAIKTHEGPAKTREEAHAPLQDVVAALAAITNQDVEYDDWVRVGLATYAATAGAGEGLEAFQRWSCKSQKHQDHECLRVWESFHKSPPRKIGFGSLYYLARASSPFFVAPTWRGQAVRETSTTPGWPKSDPDEWHSQSPQHDHETGEVNELPATPFKADLLAGLAPRQWIYGHYLIERFLSVLGAPGGTGKSAYGLGVALSIALNRPLLDEPVHKPGPVWIYNLEDPQDETLRRVWAACIQHQIDPAELEGKLYLDSGRDRPLVVAERSQDGEILCLPIVDALVEELKARKIRMLVVDPFVKSHRLEENRNEQVDFAASLWNRVADEAKCAILLMHHFRKGGEAGSADAFRGASALIDASRAAVTLGVMSEKEAGTFGVDVDERRFYIRADNAKLNLAPPPLDAVWLKLNSIQLPNGDNVQAVTRWKAPSPWQGVPMAMVIAMIDKIVTDRGDGTFWSPVVNAKERWAGQVIIEDAGKTPEQAKSMLKAWEASGLFKIEEYHDPEARKKRNKYVVDTDKLLEMKSQVRAEATPHE